MIPRYSPAISEYRYHCEFRRLERVNGPAAIIPKSDDITFHDGTRWERQLPGGRWILTSAATEKSK
jgi:hypothetical protein